MITRKDWNDLNPYTRNKAAKLVFFNMGEEFQAEMAEEWHHYNDKWHDILFSSLYWTKDRQSIKVSVTITV